jgi:hypothetical protein
VSRHLRMTSLATTLVLVVAMAAAVVALLASYTPAGAKKDDPAAASAPASAPAAASASASPPAEANDLLPDLGMLHPRGLEIDNASDGRKLLRFNSIIVNVGAGPFELRGERAAGASTMDTVRQRIFDDAGGSRDVDTPAIMEYGGDGHNHWHVQNLLDFELQRLDNGSKVGTFEKRGFCFFDNFLYGSSEPAFYQQRQNGTAGGGSCRPGPSASATHMGLSVGWGDRYGKTLPDQYIDVTGLAAGRYRLIGTADPSGWFVESDNANNVSWVDIQLEGNKVRIVARGPSA